MCKHQCDQISHGFIVNAMSQIISSKKHNACTYNDNYNDQFNLLIYVFIDILRQFPCILLRR